MQNSCGHKPLDNYTMWSYFISWWHWPWFYVVPHNFVWWCNIVKYREEDWFHIEAFLPYWEGSLIRMCIFVGISILWLHWSLTRMDRVKSTLCDKNIYFLNIFKFLKNPADYKSRPKSSIHMYRRYESSIRNVSYIEGLSCPLIHIYWNFRIKIHWNPHNNRYESIQTQ